MKSTIPAVFLISISFCPAQLLANGIRATKKLVHEPFSVVKTKLNEKETRIQIMMESGNTIHIGYITNHNPVNNLPKTGVDPSSISVHNLKGSLDLLQINWTDSPQGSGSWEHGYYLVCLKANPKIVYARGIVPLHGKWGWGTGLSGKYSITYNDSKLTIKTSRFSYSYSIRPKPLHHEYIDENKDPIFFRQNKNVLTRVYTVESDRARLVSTVFEYERQEGDTLKDICEVFKIKKNWIFNHSLIEKGVSWIQIIIPAEVSQDRYPGIDREECR
jgi:hypothetical protein